MTTATQVAASLAAGMLISQPCAASNPEDGQSMLRQSGAFAGLNVRLPLGQTQKSKPTARLQFTTSQTLRNERTGAIHTFKAQGLEIGSTKSGKLNLYLNGRSTVEAQNKINVGGAGTTLLIVGGVLLVGVLVAAASASATSDLLNPCSGDSDLCE